MMRGAILCLTVVLSLVSISAFAPAVGPIQQHHPHAKSEGLSSADMRLFMSESKKSKLKSGLDENMRNKLVTESIAPWRTVRLFLYFSFGSGAFIGGLINLSGTIAAVTANNPDLNMNTEVGCRMR